MTIKISKKTIFFLIIVLILAYFLWPKSNFSESNNLNSNKSNTSLMNKSNNLKNDIETDTEMYSNEYFTVEFPLNFEKEEFGGGGVTKFLFSGEKDNRYQITISSGSLADNADFKKTGKIVSVGGLGFKQYVAQRVDEFSYRYEYNGYDYGKGDFRIITIASEPDSDILNEDNIFWSSIKFK